MTGERSGVSRRGFLLGGAAAAAAAGAGAVAATALGEQQARGAPALIPFHGEHQAGIATPAQAHIGLVALDMAAGMDRDGLERLLRLWTDDAARLTQAEPVLADTEPELAQVPSGLTVTIGFGVGVLGAAGLSGQRPAWLRPFPPFSIDRLQDRHSGGDLFLQVCAEDRVALAHAQRVMVKDAASFASVRWVQTGFQRPGHSESGTGRNLMGQVDGTVNPAPGTPEFDSSVWSWGPPAWIRGGTGVVLRRIEMDLAGWDRVSRRERERSMGRNLHNGAPLTGESEHDVPDLEATGTDGQPLIPESAHVRRAAGPDSGPQFLRRPYHYEDGMLADGTADAGLLFLAYAADPVEQVLPVQRSLAKLDRMNEWTTPVGSAVFAIPPGCEPGGFIGETLLA